MSRRNPTWKELRSKYKSTNLYFKRDKKCIHWKKIEIAKYQYSEFTIIKTFYCPNCKEKWEENVGY